MRFPTCELYTLKINGLNTVLAIPTWQRLDIEGLEALAGELFPGEVTEIIFSCSSHPKAILNGEFDVFLCDDPFLKDAVLKATTI